MVPRLRGTDVANAAAASRKMSQKWLPISV